MRIAGYRILEARAQRGIAVGNLFPQSQQAFGDYMRTNLSKNAPNAAPSSLNYDEWTLGTSLAWELDFWGRFRRAIEAADATSTPRSTTTMTCWSCSWPKSPSSIRNLRTAEQRLEYARKNVEDQQKSLGLADFKYRNGATTRLDVTQGQSNLSQTQAIIPPLEAARRQAANQLCILMGMPPRDIEEMLGTRTIPFAPPSVAIGIPADLAPPPARHPPRRAAGRRAECADRHRRGRVVSAFLHHRLDLLRCGQLQRSVRSAILRRQRRPGVQLEHLELRPAGQQHSRAGRPIPATGL